jgi:hypothetical protein
MDVLYLDDDPRDRDNYAQDLSLGDFHVTAMAPPPDLALSVVTEGDWSLFLIDYQLTGGRDVDRANYMGATLATAVRERSDERPIVLFTRRDIVPDAEDRARTLLSVFDAVTYKGDVDAEPDAARARLVSLAEGYGRLRSSDRSWPDAVRLLGADEQEAEALQEAAPPIVSKQFEVAALARWVIHTLLAYPGAIVDSLHAAAVLGVSKDAFWDSRLQDAISPARYDGLFSPPNGRWWRDRILAIGYEFIPAFAEAAGADLAPAACVGCGETPADAVCYVLREHVRTEHSLAYYPDLRPAAMDIARVSFRALRESNAVDEDFVDSNARDLVEQIRARDHDGG